MSKKDQFASLVLFTLKEAENLYDKKESVASSLSRYVKTGKVVRIKRDLYAAIDLTVDKLERQIRKHKTKINSKNKKNVIQNFEIDLEDKFEEDESKVLKRKKVDMKPMDEEEAIMQMEMLGHSFFVFKNAETNNICVLYLRKDGNYGIIETN